MAIDHLNKYKTSTTQSDREVAKGAGSMKSDNSYSANSNGVPFGISKGDVASSIPSISNISAYRSATNILDTAYQAFQTTMKISLAEIGFWKQLITYGGVARTSDFDGTTPKSKTNSINGGANDYRAQPAVINRQDTQNEFVFRCGDYFLPLSFTYSLQASKNTALSQLVDGVEIIQQVNRRPKIITLHLRVERNPNRLDNTNTGSNMAFINANVDGVQKDNVDGSDIELEQIRYQISSLGVALNDLYEQQEVFRIENKTINTDMGLEWVMLESFAFKVNAGTSVVDIELVLHEVNMEENAVVLNQSTVDSSQSAGGNA